MLRKLIRKLVSIAFTLTLFTAPIFWLATLWLIAGGIAGSVFILRVLLFAGFAVAELLVFSFVLLMIIKWERKHQH